MTQLSQTPQKRPRRISPTPSLSSQEIAQRKTVREELAARCRVIFERLRSELRENHDKWFIAIHADSENYLLAPTLEGLVQKIRHNYPEGWLAINSQDLEALQWPLIAPRIEMFTAQGEGKFAL